jgi:hypothetical protein
VGRQSARAPVRTCGTCASTNERRGIAISQQRGLSRLSPIRAFLLRGRARWQVPAQPGSSPLLRVEATWEDPDAGIQPEWPRPNGNTPSTAGRRSAQWPASARRRGQLLGPLPSLAWVWGKIHACSSCERTLDDPHALARFCSRSILTGCGISPGAVEISAGEPGQRSVRSRPRAHRCKGRTHTSARYTTARPPPLQEPAMASQFVSSIWRNPTPHHHVGWLEISVMRTRWVPKRRALPTRQPVTSSCRSGRHQDRRTLQSRDVSPRSSRTSERSVARVKPSLSARVRGQRAADVK